MEGEFESIRDFSKATRQHINNRVKLHIFGHTAPTCSLRQKASTMHDGAWEMVAILPLSLRE